MQKLIVEPYNNEVRLDLYLAQKFSELSRSKIQNAIKSGDVTVNDKKGKKSTLLNSEDVILMPKDLLKNLNPEDLPIEAQEMNLDIIYEDDYYLAVNKPAGLVVHPGNGNPNGTLLNGLYYYMKDAETNPRLVHRLDKDTSGVIMVAKTNSAHDKLSTLFADREVYKGYLGFCIGRYPNLEGRIDAPLGRSKSDPIKRTVRPDGRNSVTDYILLKYNCGVSVIAFHLHTGRTHQIRVHSAFSGFPVVADKFYGGEKEKVKLLEPLERPSAYRIYSVFDRQALHARYISFVHPFSNEKVIIEAPFHEDFEKGISVMELEKDELNVYEGERMDSIEMNLIEEDFIE